MTRPLVLTGATLFDGTGAAPLPDARLVFEKEQVLRVGPESQVPVPPEADVRSLAGQFILPGLMDVHLHVQTPTLLDGLVRLGVTTVVDPAHPLPPLVADEPRPDALQPRPALFRSGPPIDGPESLRADAVQVATVEEARAAVRRQVAAGVHFIKLYSRLPPALLTAAIREAYIAGVRVIGDLAATSWGEAAEAGVNLLCHAWPQHPALLPEDRRLEYVTGLREGRLHPLVDWFERVDLEGPEVAGLVESMRATGVALVPTLVTLEAYVFGSADESAAVMAGWPPVPLPAREVTFERVLRFLRRLHEGGVPLLAGTDAPRVGVPVGRSLWREIRLLQHAGLSPGAALTAATGAAAALLRLDDRGVLATERRADAVVLGRDPTLRDVGPQDIRAVVVGGRFLNMPTEQGASA